MIIHQCDRCGERKEYSHAGRSRDDPHGQRACPPDKLCFECLDVQAELEKSLEIHLRVWMDRFSDAEPSAPDPSGPLFFLRKRVMPK